MIDESVRGRLPDPSFWSLPGIDQARARLKGIVPRSPLGHLIGLRLTQVGAGSATVTMPATPWMQNYDGAVDMRILLEEALALAVTTGAPAGHEVRTAALSVNVLRVSRDSDSFVARARTVNSGSLFTLAEVQVEDGAGRAVAHATGSFLIQAIEPPPPSLEAATEPVDEPIYSSPDPYLRPLPSHAPSNLSAEPDGLTFARSHLAGDSPIPIVECLGARPIDVDEGSMTWTMPASEWFCGRSLEVSPGVVATFANFGLGGAVVTVAAAGQRVGTVEQSITLLRPVRPDGRELVCRGLVVYQAADLVVSTVEISDGDGNRVVLGYQTSVMRHRLSRPSDPDGQRVLATVLFTDIVGSTGHAEQLGDSRWSELLDEHHLVVRKQLALFKGREIKTTGDGFLATFDSPGRAVQAARAIRDAVRRLGVEVRAGLHTGECEVSGADVAGIAVHIASRVQACAADGEVLVTSTVRDLVAGSGLRFTDRGRQVLKGIEGDWQLLALAE